MKIKIIFFSIFIFCSCSKFDQQKSSNNSDSLSVVLNNNAAKLLQKTLLLNNPTDSLKKAIGLLDKAIKLDSTNTNARVRKISTLLQLDKPFEALQESEKILRIDRGKVIFIHSILLDKHIGFETAKPFYEEHLEILRDNFKQTSDTTQILSNGISLAEVLILANRRSEAQSLIIELRDMYKTHDSWDFHKNWINKELSKSDILNSYLPSTK